MDPVPARHKTTGRGARQDAPAMTVLPRQIGKYEVIDRLGSGAFGVVYRCRDAALDRTVAVKVLSTAGHADPDLLERFQRESRAAARISHPHIVPVFDSGLDGDWPYLVMEHVEGQSLDRLIGSPRLTLETALRVIFHLAQALQAAHEQGVVHRDVKPANVLIDHEGRPKLTDFGLARLATDPGGLSRSGDLLGTPRYMSPEQVLLGHGEVDFRTDIYSLGAVMYEMLAGVPAADGPNAMAMLRKISDEEPVPLRQHKGQIPQEVAAICQRMMAKDRDLRYPTAGAVATDIQAFMLRKMLGTPEIELLAGLPAPPPATAPVALAQDRGTPGRLPRRRQRFFCSSGSRPPGSLSRLVPGSRVCQPGLPAIDLKRLVTRGRSELQTLSSAADARTYHDGLSDLLEDLNAAIKQYADDPELRLVRGKLLRRAGEYLAAMTDLDKASVLDDPEVVLERALARFQWEHLYLGSLPEPALRPAASASIRADLLKLAVATDPEMRFVSRIAEALTAGRPAEALKLALLRPERGSERLKADLLMLEADAFGDGRPGDPSGIAGGRGDQQGSSARAARRVRRPRGSGRPPRARGQPTPPRLAVSEGRGMAPTRPLGIGRRRRPGQDDPAASLGVRGRVPAVPGRLSPHRRRVVHRQGRAAAELRPPGPGPRPAHRGGRHAGRCPRRSRHCMPGCNFNHPPTASFRPPTPARYSSTWSRRSRRRPKISLCTWFAP